MSTTSTTPENASSLAARSKQNNNNYDAPPDSASKVVGVVVDSRNQLATASPIHHDKDTLSTSLFPPSSTTITPTTVTSPSRYPLLRSTTIREHHNPQLSERDSIFATSYTINDSNNSKPQLSQSRDDKSQDVNTDLQLPLAIVPGGVASSRSTLKLNLDSELKKKRRLASSTNPGKETFNKVKEGLPDAVRQSRAATVSMTKAPHPPQRSQTTYQLQMSPALWQQSDAVHQKVEFAELPSNNPPRPEDNIPRQEERIEAVLTDDPAPHGRSRKASHYLGIFKEKGNVQESGKASKDKSRDNDRDKSIDYQGTIKSSRVSDLASPEPLEPVPTEEVSGTSNDADKPYAPTLNHETSSQAPSPLASLFSHRSSLTETEDEAISTLGDNIEWRSSETADGDLPIRLLKNDTTEGKPTIVSKQRSRSDLNLDAKQSSPSSTAEPEDEDEFSDKEHIASATYYPHEAPSPETAAQAKLLTEEEVRQTEPDIGSPAQKIDLDNITSPVLQDGASLPWNIESKDKIQYLEHDFVKARRKSTKLTERTRWSIVSVPSDTEYESGYDTSRSERGYESAVTDGGDVTPTATPQVTSTFPGRKSKKPLKAVELKPYQHQVGGHTKVFSFSKQAICKQLNNRENVFYEVIERRHPELLTFLPKYLGVLNVTYKKSQQRRKNEKIKIGNPNSADIQPDGKQETLTPKSSIPSSHTRVISHSSGFDKLDDAVPQVVYANNMHIIPDNLFRRRMIHDGTVRPATSDGVLGDVLNKTQSASGDISATPRRSRPSLAKSISAWGATMINTQLKEKVLREVFSPPQIHHRQRGRRRRSRNEFHSLRGQAEKYSDFAESTDVALFSSTEPIDGTEKSLSPNLMFPTNTASKKEDIKVGSAPHAGEQTLSRLPSDRSQDSAQIGDNPQRAKSIRRRRSGGGLRRKQNEIVDGTRGEFEYYEEADLDMGKEHIFSMELLSQTSPNVGQVDGLPFVNLAGIDKSSETSTAEPTPTSQPVNPLEAQQSPDERVEHFLLLEDLTAGMSRPCVLDLKMGTRQYGIDASKKKQQSQRQKCKSTTSQQLGVRLCGMQVWNARTLQYKFEDKYAGRDIHAGPEFQEALLRFLSDGVSATNALRHIPPLLEKLSKLENIIVNLPGYRFYASSLLVLYDGNDRREDNIDPRSVVSNRSAGKDRSGLPYSSIDVRLVDFANCVTGEDKLPEDTRCPPKDRDGVDRGYIRGLKSLRRYLRRIWRDISEEQRAERGETEKREEGSWGDEWNVDDGEVSV